MRRLVACAVSALLAAAVLSAIGPLIPAANAAPADGPALVLSKSTAKLGEYISVTGNGFPAGARLQVEICGIGGSSNSCAIAAAVAATTDAGGGFRQTLPVVEPPTPCPCTVHAAPFAGTAADPVDAPISIPGLRYLPQAVPPGVGSAKLMAATATGDSPFLTQLGAGGSAQVTVTFANLGALPAPDPGLVLTVSRGGKQVGRYPVAWTGGDLAAGGRRTLTSELSLPGGWFRDYEIDVVIGAPGNPITVRTLSAAVRPWGELVAPATLVVGLLCLLAACRRRLEPVKGLPVRQGAVEGRGSGADVPEPFSGLFSEPLSTVEPPEPEIMPAAPGHENATAETAEIPENESA